MPSAGPHGNGPDLVVRGRSCRSLMPGRGPRFGPQSSGVLPAQRNECSTAEQSMGLSPLLSHHHHHHPPEDDRCSVRSLQQGENIRHLYNWLKMREKKREKKRWKREKQGDRLCGCVFAHEWDIEHRVCTLVAFLCVITKYKILQRQKKNKKKGKIRERGTVLETEKKGRGSRRGREVGNWHRWGWLSLNRTSFHTYYTCPLQSSHRTVTGASL